MSRLERVLWGLYIRGDTRISVLESFQSEPHTYVKVFVDDGTHGITVQEITIYPFPFCNNRDLALQSAIRSALEKAADVIRAQAFVPIEAQLIAKFS